MSFAAESGGAGSQVLDIDFARRRGHDGVLPSEPRIQPGVGLPDAGRDARCSVMRLYESTNMTATSAGNDRDECRAARSLHG
jgi:hypothetical protein